MDSVLWGCVGEGGFGTGLCGRRRWTLPLGEAKTTGGNEIGGLRLLVVKFDRNLPEIFPGIASLIGSKKLRSTGTAVIEESESCWGGYVLC